MVDWNRDFALEQTGGDEDLLVELLGLFRDSSASDLDKLRGAITQGDSDGVVRAAHSIKGAAASLGFETLRQLAYAIESDGRGGSVERGRAELPRLEKILSDLPVR
ncbi:MAG: histidine phosphotransferase [Desulfobulbaceae bacterium A2]|nr:MAG: histidine phosphotransferase [Desulfobulbaceae bacterium A2]